MKRTKRFPLNRYRRIRLHHTKCGRIYHLYGGTHTIRLRSAHTDQSNHRGIVSPSGNNPFSVPSSRHCVTSLSLASGYAEQLDDFVHGSFTLRPIESYTHRAYKSVTARANGNYAAHWPSRTRRVFVDHEHYVALAEVVAWSRPLAALLQRWQEVGPPARPELVGEVLDSAPSSSAVQVRPPELSRRR